MPKAPETKATCKICKKQITKRSYKRHLEIHDLNRQRFQCNICQQDFLRQESLLKHLRLIHRKGSLTKYEQCVFCEKKLASVFKLENHLRVHTHERPFFCKSCSHESTQKGNLWFHNQRNHLTKLKRYKCDLCPATFCSSSELNPHIQAHLGEKPLKCNDCTKFFKTKGELKIHSRCHIKEKLFACLHCCKTFSRKDVLHSHLRTHSGVKLFSCDICRKQFTQRSSLNAHTRTHTGLKPFSCNICDKTFVQKCKLAEHCLTHTGEKPFQCGICKKRFSTSGNLRQHGRTHKQNRT